MYSLFVSNENIATLRQKFPPVYHRFFDRGSMGRWFNATSYNDDPLLRSVKTNPQHEVSMMNNKYITWAQSAVYAGRAQEEKSYTPHHLVHMQRVVNKFNDNPKQGPWRAMEDDRFDPLRLAREYKKQGIPTQRHMHTRRYDYNIDEALLFDESGEYEVNRGFHNGRINTLRRSGYRERGVQNPHNSHMGIYADRKPRANYGTYNELI